MNECHLLYENLITLSVVSITVFIMKVMSVQSASTKSHIFISNINS
jgi:hypothetical protein